MGTGFYQSQNYIACLTLFSTNVLLQNLKQKGFGNVAKADANIPLPLTIAPREGQVMTFEDRRRAFMIFQSFHRGGWKKETFD